MVNRPHRRAHGVSRLTRSPGGLTCCQCLADNTQGTQEAPMTPTPAHRALTEDQQGRLSRAAERAGARDHALVALALDAGLRTGEIARLDDADVSITAGAGHVREAAGKAAMPREVPLRARARSFVTPWPPHPLQPPHRARA